MSGRSGGPDCLDIQKPRSELSEFLSDCNDCLEQVFNCLDARRSGTLKQDDFVIGLGALGFTGDSFNEFFEIDADRDGVITIDDFVSHFSPKIEEISAASTIAGFLARAGNSPGLPTEDGAASDCGRASVSSLSTTGTKPYPDNITKPLLSASSPLDVTKPLMPESVKPYMSNATKPYLPDTTKSILSEIAKPLLAATSPALEEPSQDPQNGSLEFKILKQESRRRKLQKQASANIQEQHEAILEALHGIERTMREEVDTAVAEAVARLRDAGPSQVSNGLQAAPADSDVLAAFQEKLEELEIRATTAEGQVSSLAEDQRNATNMARRALENMSEYKAEISTQYAALAADLSNLRMCTKLSLAEFQDTLHADKMVAELSQNIAEGMDEPEGPKLGGIANHPRVGMGFSGKGLRPHAASTSLSPGADSRPTSEAGWSSKSRPRSLEVPGPGGYHGAPPRSLEVPGGLQIPEDGELAPTEPDRKAAWTHALSPGGKHFWQGTSSASPSTAGESRPTSAGGKSFGGRSVGSYLPPRGMESSGSRNLLQESASPQNSQMQQNAAAALQPRPTMSWVPANAAYAERGSAMNSFVPPSELSGRSSLDAPAQQQQQQDRLERVSLSGGPMSGSTIQGSLRSSPGSSAGGRSPVQVGIGRGASPTQKIFLQSNEVPASRTPGEVPTAGNRARGTPARASEGGGTGTRRESSNHSRQSLQSRQSHAPSQSHSTPMLHAGSVN